MHARLQTLLQPPSLSAGARYVEVEGIPPSQNRESQAHARGTSLHLAKLGLDMPGDSTGAI